MKKKLVRGFMSLTLVIGICSAVITSSSEVHACKQCNTSNLNRKCKCGSTRLFVKKNYTAPNGKLRNIWECKECKHTFVTELRNGKDVILTEKEL